MYKISTLIILFVIMSVFSVQAASPKRALVVGASSGMGAKMVELLAEQGYRVGMAARSLDKLEKIQQKIPTQTYCMQMDVANHQEAVEKLQELIQLMGGLDLLILASTGAWDADFESNDWRESRAVLDVDVVGFYALAKTGLAYFEQQGHGHLVGFSSIDSLHGAATHPAYCAAKAFCSRYLEGERNKYIQRNVPIIITDIVPGWVNSREGVDYTQLPHAYWVESLDDACNEIMQAINEKVSVAYITKRWEKVAKLLSTIPNDLYNALCARPGGKL